MEFIDIRLLISNAEYICNATYFCKVCTVSLGSNLHIHGHILLFRVTMTLSMSEHRVNIAAYTAKRNAQKACDAQEKSTREEIKSPYKQTQPYKTEQPTHLHQNHHLPLMELMETTHVLLL